MLDALLPLFGAGAAVFAATHAFRERQAPATESLVLGLEMLPFGLLLLAFLVDWDSLALVRTYGSASLPLAYRVSAVWAGRAGPLLLWAAMLALVRLWLRRRDDELATDGFAMHVAIGVLLLLAAMLRPFRLAVEGASRGEMNALLQTDLMVVHPPIVFLYYALCVAVAATVIEAHRAGFPGDEVHLALLRPARAAVLVGAFGIGLGGLWAYTVLDWGGYWAWDPVETASLLPWLGCLLVVHLRITPRPPLDHLDIDRSAAARWGPPLGLLVGALAFHSTMVTRANGVWASVHAFVSTENEVVADDAWLRVLQLWDNGVQGAEVLTEFFLFLLLLLLACLFITRHRLEELERFGIKPLITERPALSWVLLLGVVAVAVLAGDTAVLLFGMLFATLLVNGDGERPEGVWTAAGTATMLLSAWSWHMPPELAFVGMALFLAPWVLLVPEESKDASPPAARSWGRRLPDLARLAFWLPLTAGGAFLMITWLLLLSEVDGASLAAHEVYGAPLIALIAAGLTLYALRRALSPARANIIVGCLLVVSVTVAWLGVGGLPGDGEAILTGGLTRGAVARFLLVWLLFALFPMLAEALRAGRNWLEARRAAAASPLVASEAAGGRVVDERTEGEGAGRERASRQRADRRVMQRLRVAAAMVAHLGILLLLVGHVMTTTLVVRGDPLHQTTLLLDEPVTHGDLLLTMREIDLSKRGDASFDDRFVVGDAFVGVTVEVSDSRGGDWTVTPGMLRFDSDSGRITARSEVARLTSLSGDRILILDASQANDLMSRSLLGELDEVQRVRLTVYDLPGSHLVWLGWILIVMASGTVLLTDGRVGSGGRPGAGLAAPDTGPAASGSISAGIESSEGRVRSGRDRVGSAEEE